MKYWPELLACIIIILSILHFVDNQDKKVNASYKIVVDDQSKIH